MKDQERLDGQDAGPRLTGEQATRLEAFVGAAFGFSLTLLVIFTSDLPRTAAELREALKKVPAFAARCAVPGMPWCHAYRERQWRSLQVAVSSGGGA